MKYIQAESWGVCEVILKLIKNPLKPSRVPNSNEKDADVSIILKHISVDGDSRDTAICLRLLNSNEWY